MKNVKMLNNNIIEHISPLASLEHELMLFGVSKKNVDFTLDNSFIN